MPLPERLRHEQMTDRAVAEEEARRFQVRHAVLTVLLCMGWQAVGAAVLAYALHATLPVDRARVLLRSAVGIAAAGTVVTVLIRQTRLRDGGYE